MNDANALIVEADHDFVDWCERRNRWDRPAEQPPGVLAGATIPHDDQVRWVAPPPNPPTVRAAPWQRNTVYAAVQRARDWGLKFPVFNVAFVERFEHPQYKLGETRVHVEPRGDGENIDITLQVRLLASLGPDDLMFVILHELFHVTDAARGAKWPRSEYEARADAFAERITGRRVP